MPRTSTEIFKDLRSAMAELEHALKTEGKATDEELSPLLRAALEQKSAQRQDLGRSDPEPLQTPLPQGYLNEREGAASERLPRPERPERLKDYTPAHDPEWDEAAFMGTGDRRVD